MRRGNNYSGARWQYSQRTPKPQANRYDGECVYCHQTVKAGDGIASVREGHWTVTHRPAHWHGSPVSGRYVDGCPGEADKLNHPFDCEEDSYQVEGDSQ